MMLWTHPILYALWFESKWGTFSNRIQDLVEFGKLYICPGSVGANSFPGGGDISDNVWDRSQLSIVRNFVAIDF